MALDLKDKVAWITGTSRGIGPVLARGFAQRGATVVATCRGGESRASELLADLQKISPKSMVLSQDVRLPEDADKVAKTIQEKLGRLDILINNAGIDPRKPADQITDADWRDVLSTNLDGTWYCCRAAIPLMKKAGYGKIIQAGSITVAAGKAHLAHYIASKMGLIGLTRGLARDLGGYGIRVNCVILGAVEVEKEAQLGEGTVDDILKLVNAKQCIPGRIQPADVEPTFALLAAAEGDAITGQCITVDKGWICY